MSGYRFESLSLMVVDDNHHMRALVRALLASMQIQQIDEVADAALALERMKDRQIDILITDFLMSPLDGIDLTKLIRTSSDSPNTYLPIIMLTGFSERHRVEAARDAGVTEFVRKPLNARTLYERILEIIERPRPFVRTGEFFGPDRRRRKDPDHPQFGRRAEDRGVQPDVVVLDE